jgi:multidrug resistance efflux pump
MSLGTRRGGGCGRRKRSMSRRAILMVLAGAAVVGGLFYSQWRRVEPRVSGFVEADEIRLGSRVGGRVLRVRVEEGQSVKEGQVLVELEAFDLEELRAQAAGQLAARKAEHEKLASGFRREEVAQAKARRDELAARLLELRNGPRKETIQAAQARLEQAQAEANYAASSLSKIRSSFEQAVATQEELDKAINGADSSVAAVAMRKAELAELQAGTRPEEIQTAQAQLEQAQQAYDLLKAGARPEDVESARWAAEAAEAALKVIEKQLAELQIKAPAAGVIESLDLQPGDLVPPNSPALTMLSNAQAYVRAFVPEHRLALQLGSRVLVSTDSLPGRRFAAHVVFLSRQAEFAPSNIQTTQKRSEEVFRIKVALDEGLEVLRPGMPVDLWLGGGERR